MFRFAEEFVAFRTSTDAPDYVRALSEHASLATWLDVVQRFPAMRIWVAHNNAVPLEVLRVRARNPEETVRVRIAWNGKAPAEILDRLAGDESPLVRDAALQRLNRPGTKPDAG